MGSYRRSDELRLARIARTHDGHVATSGSTLRPRSRQARILEHILQSQHILQSTSVACIPVVAGGTSRDSERPRTLNVGQARMTYIEQAIKEAVDHGYEPNVERYPEMEGISPLQIAVAMQADVFIDPAFWKALGRKRGWTTDDDFKYWQKSVAEWKEKYWKNFWHRFIDHLAADKDAESFFKELDSKAQERPDSHH